MGKIVCAILHLSFDPQREVLLAGQVHMQHVPEPMEGLDTYFLALLYFFHFLLVYFAHVAGYLLHFRDLLLHSLL